MPYRVPSATYRIQFNADFTFADAKAVVPYLADLGITDLYVSPLLRPREGSTHGYDVADATALNPALGGEEGFEALHGELRARDIGVLLDIVPNHMAASHENTWWMSVLENGPLSRFLHYFDIDWRPSVTGDREEKVLLPILGRPYGEALEEQEIRLGFDSEGFFFSYYDKRLPLAPRSYSLVLRECLETLPTEGPGIEIRDLVQNEEVIANSRFMKDTLWRIHEQSPEFRESLARAIERLNGEKGNQESFNALDRLLDAQWYRLAYWRIASETINYRRFFDVTDLVGVKIENPEVFEQRNRVILDMIAQGKISGVRIDHIDGLFEPVSYLSRLQLRLGDPGTEEREKFYVVVEKILEHGELLPDSFLCAGTTGYDFLSTANNVYVDVEGLRQLTRFYEEQTGSTQSFDEMVYEKKKLVVEQLFPGEMRALGTHLTSLAIADRNARDFAPSELLAALTEVTCCLPVYRTYLREDVVSDSDRDVLRRAIADARRRAGSLEPRLFDFLELLLVADPPAYIAGERQKWLEFVMRWQQFTGRVMAKGVEDTAFYNYNRLISLNEVGGEPGREPPFDAVDELHDRNERIARDWPHTMNALSTHDTKRSEDVRARIHVISELAEEWRREVKAWSRINEALRRDGVPDPNVELMLYQTLVGVWPLHDREVEQVPARLHAFLEKAAREAKVQSSWLAPNSGYEQTLKNFASAILAHEPFVTRFRRFQKRVAVHGFLNSLSQLVLKVCSPGVPDFYQGTEMWDFSLVDPDNRRPVDYVKRAAALRKDLNPTTMLRNWKDGRIKLFVTARSLALRKRHQATFTDGAYTRVASSSESAVAFLRGDDLLVVVPRLTTRIARAPQLPLGDAWGDASLEVGGRWRNGFTRESVEGERLLLRDVFATFPVAIFEKETP